MKVTQISFALTLIKPTHTHTHTKTRAMEQILQEREERKSKLKVHERGKFLLQPHTKILCMQRERNERKKLFLCWRKMKNYVLQFKSTFSPLFSFIQSFIHGGEGKERIRL
jgi:hypothetical protein